MGSMRGGSMPQPSAEMRQKFEAKFESAAKGAGFDVNQLKDLRSQIESAVQEAASGVTGDPRSAVESAINGVLEDNGIDPAEFKDKMGAVFEKMGMPTPGSAGFGGGGYSAQGASINGNQNELLSKLIASLSGDSSGGLFANLPAGSLVDAAA
jgi:hypothetical protein